MFLTWCNKSSSFSLKAGIWSLKICERKKMKTKRENNDENLISSQYGRLNESSHLSKELTLLSLGAMIAKLLYSKEIQRRIDCETHCYKLHASSKGEDMPTKTLSKFWKDLSLTSDPKLSPQTHKRSILELRSDGLA